MPLLSSDLKTGLSKLKHKGFGIFEHSYSQAEAYAETEVSTRSSILRLIIFMLQLE